MIKSRQKFFNTLLVISDALIIVSSFIISWYIRFETLYFGKGIISITLNDYLQLLIYIIPSHIIIMKILGLYNPHRIKTIFSEVINIIMSNSLSIIIFMSILYIIKEIHFSRYVLLIFYLISTLFLSLERFFIRKALRLIRAKGFNLKHIIIVGIGKTSIDFLDKIKENKTLGYNVVGFIGDKCKEESVCDAKVIGNIDNIEEVLRIHTIDEIIIALPNSKYQQINNIIFLCEKYGIKSKIIPDYYNIVPAKPYIDDLDGIPLINTRYVPLDDYFYKFIKRFFDILASILIIIVTSPIILASMMIIKVTSPGPIIFKQTRVGMHNKEFNMYKLRSMKYIDREISATTWSNTNPNNKTLYGKFMRKMGLDELPQLINVLKGNMSIIGPRPERPYFVEKFREDIPKYMIKHHVRPGITGWAQVNGWRGNTSITERIKCDIYYIENWTLLLDIKIFFMTFLAFKSGK